VIGDGVGGAGWLCSPARLVEGAGALAAEWQRSAAVMNVAIVTFLACAMGLAKNSVWGAGVQKAMSP
jgi:hypothetical protein